MASPWPFTVGGETFNKADFNPYTYVTSLARMAQAILRQCQNMIVGTSGDSMAIGTGSKSFTVLTPDGVPPAFGGFPRLYIRDAAAPQTNYMVGAVTAFNTATGQCTVSVDTIGGSGTKTSWLVTLAGENGAATGASNAEPYLTIGNTAGLSAERALTVGAGIRGTDAGANTTYTLDWKKEPEDVSGSTYTMLAADAAKLKRFTNASGCAVTALRATSGGSAPIGFVVDGIAIGGPVTITPTTSTIMGAASYVVPAGQRFRLISNGSDDWKVELALQVPDFMTPGGAVSLSATDPVPESDQAGATTVYYLPYRHSKVPVWNGSTWAVADIGAGVSQTLADTTKSPAATSADKIYDVFCWIDSGTVRATRGPAWSSDTARGTGAGTTELELFNGIWVNKNAVTNGPAARRGAYVGSFRTDGSNQANDTLAKRHVFNAHNGVVRPMRVIETTDNWAYTTATFRQARASTANQLDFLIGLPGRMVRAQVQASASNTGVSEVSAAIGLDSTTTVAPGCINGVQVTDAGGAETKTCAPSWSGYPGIGRHFLAWLEWSAATGTTTWFGDNGSPTRSQCGIFGELVG